MDTNAFVLAVIVVAATEFVKRVLASFGIVTDGWRTQVVAIGVAIGFVWFVGATVWADEQVIGGKPLELLGTADKFFAGVVIGLGANVADRTLRTVAQIGTPAHRDDVPR